MAIDRLLDIGTFIISILCGFLFIPLTLNFCKAKGLYDIPNGPSCTTTSSPGLEELPSFQAW